MENSSINNYKCPACGGGLTFNPSTGKIVCEYCDSSYSVEEIEQIYKPQEVPENQAAESALQDENSSNENATLDSSEGTWNTDNLNSNWGEDSAKMKEYNCPSCGANLICEETTAATACPYCGNPTIIETQFAGTLKPDYILPFKVQKKEAVSALREFYKGKKLLANEFADENHLEEVKGIYVPFWLFDGVSEGSAKFETTLSTCVRHGNKETTTTRHFDCYREGKIEFSKIPVDASEKMPDDMMDSLEPFHFDDLKEFSTAYLPGYLADKYDVTVDQSMSRADNRCASTFLATMRKSVVGYETCRMTDKNVTLKKGTVHYALLPVYLLYTKWNNQKFLFAVNGQTGRVVGDLPISSKKSRIYFFTQTLVGLLIGGIVGGVGYGILKFLGLL